MINGIQQGKQKETDDNILKKLGSVQSFLYRHFKNSPHYRQTLPSLHLTSRFFACSKTSKFENINDITIDNLIIDNSNYRSNRDMLLQHSEGDRLVFKTTHKK